MGIKKESDREDQLPDEIQEYLANEYLDRLLKEEDLEPEMLIWGLVNIMEIVLKIADFSRRSTLRSHHAIREAEERRTQWIDSILLAHHVSSQV
jgi:hypothetical protein